MHKNVLTVLIYHIKYIILIILENIPKIKGICNNLIEVKIYCIITLDIKKKFFYVTLVIDNVL